MELERERPVREGSAEDQLNTFWVPMVVEKPRLEQNRRSLTRRSSERRVSSEKEVPAPLQNGTHLRSNSMKALNGSSLKSSGNNLARSKSYTQVAEVSLTRNNSITRSKRMRNLATQEALDLSDSMEDVENVSKYSVKTVLREQVGKLLFCFVSFLKTLVEIFYLVKHT